MYDINNNERIKFTWISVIIIILWKSSVKFQRFVGFDWCSMYGCARIRLYFAILHSNMRNYCFSWLNNFGPKIVNGMIIFLLQKWIVYTIYLENLKSKLMIIVWISEIWRNYVIYELIFWNLLVLMYCMVCVNSCGKASACSLHMSLG